MQRIPHQVRWKEKDLPVRRQSDPEKRAMGGRLKSRSAAKERKGRKEGSLIEALSMRSMRSFAANHGVGFLCETTAIG